MFNNQDDSEDFPVSSIEGIMKRIKGHDIEVVVYEIVLKEGMFYSSKLIRDLD